MRLERMPANAPLDVVCKIANNNYTLLEQCVAQMQRDINKSKQEKRL